MPYVLSFTIHGLPKRPNQVLHKHWRSNNREAQNWIEAVWKTVGAKKPPKPLNKARLICIRYSSSEPDYDGLVGSFKHVIDGLKACGVIQDDKSSVIGIPTYHWERAPAKAGRIFVQVEEIQI